MFGMSPTYDQGMQPQAIGAGAVFKPWLLDFANEFDVSIPFFIVENGTYRITARAGGGSGSASGNTVTAGGGSGALAQKTLKLSAGAKLQLCVGKGGSGVSNGHGRAGSTSYVTGPGIDLYCYGGEPGTASGGAGGQANGGDLNLNGSAGGQWMNQYTPSDGAPGLGPAGGLGGKGSTAGLSSAYVAGGGAGAPGLVGLPGGTGSDARDGANLGSASVFNGAGSGGTNAYQTNPGATGNGGNGIVRIERIA